MKYSYKQYSYPQGVPPFSQVIQTEPPYIVIDGVFIYPNTDKFLSKFEFKQNKRGGDVSKVSFGKQVLPLEVGASVELYINRRLAYQGFIEQRVNKQGIDLTVLPLWAKMNYVYITGGIVIEATLSVYQLLQDLKPFINKAGLGFSVRLIDVPKDIMITIATQGKNIVEILDECEKVMPAGYFWYVKNGSFYFTGSEENPSEVISWFKGQFSDSEIDRDFADIFTEASVFMKITDPEGNSYDESLGVVGVKPPYPPIQLKEYLGVKETKISYPYTLDRTDALDMAYNRLLTQFLPVKIKLKGVNIDKYFPQSMKAVKVYAKPIASLTVRFTRTGGGVGVGGLQYAGGELFPVDSRVGFSPKSDNPFIFDLSKNIVYQDFCNASQNLINVNIKYVSNNSITNFELTDGEQSILFQGSFRQAFLNLEDYNIDKRKVVIRCLDDDFTFGFSAMYITFSECSDIDSGVVRGITYTMDSNFILNVNMDIANVGMVLNGYLWKQQKKQEELEAILSLNLS